MTNLEKSTDKFDDIIKYLSDDKKLELKDNIKNFHKDILSLKCTLTYAEALLSNNEKQQLNKNNLYDQYIKYIKNFKHVEPRHRNKFHIFEYDDVY
jgi:geranylgeranyl pyrophosphate synthase